MDYNTMEETQVTNIETTKTVDVDISSSNESVDLEF